MGFSHNPPPRPIMPFNQQDIHHHFNELYKTIYPLWERLGGFNSTIANQNINLSAKGNSGTSENILLQYSIKGKTLNKYAQAIGFGGFANNDNNKRIRVYFGSSLVLDTGILPLNSGFWEIKSEIFRVNVSSQKVISSINSNNATLGNKFFYYSINQNLANDLILNFTVNGVSAGDITQEGLIVNLL